MTKIDALCMQRKVAEDMYICLINSNCEHCLQTECGKREPNADY